MSQLDDIAYIDTLKVQTISGDNALKIYANGRHQAAIEIIVKAVTKDNTPLKSADEVHKGLYLCFADDASNLNWKGNNGWCYTNEEGEYNGDSLGSISVATTGNVGNDGTLIFKWFVSSTIVQTRRIAVSIHTSSKHFTTADNATGAEKSSVHIEARQPIDYSDSENTEIKMGAFQELATNLFWESDVNFLNIYKSHWDGKSQRRIAEIHPTPRTGQTKFKKHQITYDPIQWYHVNKENIGWHGEQKRCFDLMQSNYPCPYPCAVIARSKNDKHFEISLWYSRQNDIKIEGSVFVASSDYYYKLNPNTGLEKHIGDDEHGIPSLLLYQFSFPTGSYTYHWKWENKVHTPTVTVTDYYGNEGSFKLAFNTDKNFDEPGKM